MALGPIRVVFIDDGGVLNDNERRGAEWRRLLGEYLSPRLGGTPEAWADANRIVFEREWARYLERLNTGPSTGMDAWVRQDRARWLAEMCEAVGVAAPADPDYAIETGVWVSERVRADIPGAIEAVHWLAERGLVLHMASGGMSWELDPYLRGMGIRHRFDRLYGPDLVDTAKNGVHFYEAITGDAGADTAHSVVVEDAPHAREWATSVGVRTYASLPELRRALTADSR